VLTRKKSVSQPQPPAAQNCPPDPATSEEKIKCFLERTGTDDRDVAILWLDAATADVALAMEYFFYNRDKEAAATASGSGNVRVGMYQAIRVDLHLYAGRNRQQLSQPKTTYSTICPQLPCSCCDWWW